MQCNSVQKNEISARQISAITILFLDIPSMVSSFLCKHSPMKRFYNNSFYENQHLVSYFYSKKILLIKVIP